MKIHRAKIVEFLNSLGEGIKAKEHDAIERRFDARANEEGYVKNDDLLHVLDGRMSEFRKFQRGGDPNPASQVAPVVCLVH